MYEADLKQHAIARQKLGVGLAGWEPGTGDTNGLQHTSSAQLLKCVPTKV
jgi:hypothetical protein